MSLKLLLDEDIPPKMPQIPLERGALVVSDGQLYRVRLPKEP